MVKLPRRSSLNFKQTVTSLRDKDDTDTSPFSGVIEDVMINFKNGCNSMVEVIIYLGNTKIFPDRREGIAFDSSTPSFRLDKPIGAGDTIRVKLLNHDNTNDHTVSVVLNLVEGEK